MNLEDAANVRVGDAQRVPGFRGQLRREPWPRALQRAPLSQLLVEDLEDNAHAAGGNRAQDTKSASDEVAGLK